MRSFHHPTCKFILLNRIESGLSLSLFLSFSLSLFIQKLSLTCALPACLWLRSLAVARRLAARSKVNEGRWRPNLLRFCWLDLPCLYSI